ncbi:MAG: serine/threonine protein kinase [Actinobacteria bacterium]|nr:serine/threonine protein kinase [Actinomycetota bacterium]
MPSHHPGDRIDNYEVKDLLGAGGWAEVFRAIDTRTGKTVVLKCPNSQVFADPAAFSRYRREIDIARSLNHPGVQRSVDAGHHRSEPYEVLEYVEGDNLRRVLADRRPHSLPVSLVEDWGAQLATTLSYLHERGIAHRDLKPENILVGSDGVLKICDFGAALRLRARRLTWRHLADAIGTPEYMSPEQVQGKRGDARSDLYALGVILYELVAGTPPFSGGTWQQTMSMHLTASPAPLSGQRADIPAGLEAAIGRCLRRRPEDRYQRADQLRADLTTVDRAEAWGPVSVPDPPMRGLAVGSDGSLLRFTAVVAASFVGLVGVIITLSVLLR